MKKKAKTKKSVTKRFRFTKSGKVLRRKTAIDHFRTRKTTKNVRRKRKASPLDFPLKKIINY